MVFDAHEKAFAFFGGECVRGIYDNMRTAARRARPQKALDAKAFRSEDRNGILLLEAQEAEHRRLGDLGRALRRPDQCAGRADVRRRRRPDLQEIGPGREGVRPLGACPSNRFR